MPHCLLYIHTWLFSNFYTDFVNTFTAFAPLPHPFYDYLLLAVDKLSSSYSCRNALVSFPDHFWVRVRVRKGKQNRTKRREMNK